MICHCDFFINIAHIFPSRVEEIDFLLTFIKSAMIHPSFDPSTEVQQFEPTYAFSSVQDDIYVMLTGSNLKEIVNLSMFIFVRFISLET